MAPLARTRATREAFPTPVMAQYYAQRTGAGLIIFDPRVSAGRAGAGATRPE